MEKRFSLYENGGFWAVLENEVNDGTIGVKSYCGAELIISRMNELAEEIVDLKQKLANKEQKVAIEELEKMKLFIETNTLVATFQNDYGGYNETEPYIPKEDLLKKIERQINELKEHI